MTVDLLAATFFWPEGTSRHVREDPSSVTGAAVAPAQASDPSPEAKMETFWDGVLRQIGWPLPPKPATHG